MEVINALGRRKTAVARVYVKSGSGSIVVNKRDYKEYFPTGILQFVVEQPLALTGNVGNYDIKVNLNGGGINGQAEALSLAVSRALCEINPEFRPVLKAKASFAATRVWWNARSQVVQKHVRSSNSASVSLTGKRLCLVSKPLRCLCGLPNGCVRECKHFKIILCQEYHLKNC